MLGTLPEGLARALGKSRLVVLVEAGDAAPAIEALPGALWLTLDRKRAVPAASDIEQGLLREISAGAVIEISDVEELGTPRRPTRFGDWLAGVLRTGTLLVLAGPQETAVRKRLLALASSRAVVAAGTEIEPLLNRLAEESRGVPPRPLPSLPAASRPRMLGVMAAAMGAAAMSWLLLYASYGGAQNWRWLHLAPGLLILSAIFLALLPLIGRAVAGHDVPAAECYARAVARWSRPPRASAAVVAALITAAAPWWLAARYAPATFLVLYEAAGVVADGRDVGACKAEEPCTLIVPRNSHLHFEGAGGECGMDMPAAQGIIIVDLEEQGCQPPDDSTSPSPRSG